MLNATADPAANVTSADIFVAGCLTNPFDWIACTREVVLSTILFITGLACIQRIYRLHTVRHRALHHYVIFYSSWLCTACCVVHWILGDYIELDLVAQWFKHVSYLLVTHFFWTRTHRSTGRRIRCCFWSFLVIGFLYSSSAAILGTIDLCHQAQACISIGFMLMSGGELCIVQLLLLAACFISQRLNSISTLSFVRTSQKCKLWSLFLSLELSAVAGVSYDVSMFVLHPRYLTCSRIFRSSQLIYTSIFGVFMVLKFALPIWALLVALDPVPAVSVSEPDDDTISQDVASTSTVGDRRMLYIPRLLRSLRMPDDGPSSPPSP